MSAPAFAPLGREAHHPGRQAFADVTEIGREQETWRECPLQPPLPHGDTVSASRVQR